MILRNIRNMIMTAGMFGAALLWTRMIMEYNAECAEDEFENEEKIIDVEVVEVEVVEEVSKEEPAEEEPEEEKPAEEEPVEEEPEEPVGTPLKQFKDCLGKELEIGDNVLIEYNKIFKKGQVVNLSHRSVELIIDEDEYTITMDPDEDEEADGEQSPCFLRILKITPDMALDTNIEEGTYVIYIKVSYNTFEGFGFGTVSHLTPNYVHIDIGDGEIIRKSFAKVLRF